MFGNIKLMFFRFPFECSLRKCAYQTADCRPTAADRPPTTDQPPTVGPCRPYKGPICFKGLECRPIKPIWQSLLKIIKWPCDRCDRSALVTVSRKVPSHTPLCHEAKYSGRESNPISSLGRRRLIHSAMRAMKLLRPYIGPI